eukprot:CAMPEP_0179878496 /NCGR_PEP_ID=MMETSP0982-20121206/25413_1 /TAXON_ID=483367 /ORGANISM="non described non described, Strain CCMP 2436" /LENGTH=191 /DNA_ID=CAMNT_0021771283 /DNA_START=33 /DNA_END=605 /DNA_ORIENTATION=+
MQRAGTNSDMPSATTPLLAEHRGADSGAEVLLDVGGLSCGHCDGRVHSALLAVPGVISANVSHESASARVYFQPRAVSVAQMLAAIKGLGYTAAVSSTDPSVLEQGRAPAAPPRPSRRIARASVNGLAFELRVLDMRCVACSAWVEEAVRGVPGVEEATVSLPTRQLSVVTQAGGAVTREKIAAAVVAAGY